MVNILSEPIRFIQSESEKKKEELRQGIKNAGVYLRVSSKKDEQKQSIAEQEEYFKNYFEEPSRKGKYNVRFYIDWGVSGKSATNRKEFKRLMQDCNIGLIDEIYTKSISRFSRNMAITMSSLEELDKLGVPVFFTMSNMSTLDKNMKIAIAVMSQMAQLEIEDKSDAIGTTFKNKSKRGEFLTSFERYGFKYISKTDPNAFDKDGNLLPENERISIVEEEANILKTMKNWFLIEKIGTGKIARMLNERNINTRNGKNWTAAGVQRALLSEKNAGCIYTRKSFKNGMLDEYKKMDLITRTYNTEKAPDGMVFALIENHHDPIWSIDEYNAILNEFLKKRKDYKLDKRNRHSDKKVFSSKVKCAYCGKSYIEVKNKRGNYWVCSTKRKEGKSFCEHSIYLKEETLKLAFQNLLKEIIENKEQFIFEEIIPLKKIYDKQLEELFDNKRNAVDIIKQREKVKTELALYNKYVCDKIVLNDHDKKQLHELGYSQEQIQSLEFNIENERNKRIAYNDTNRTTLSEYAEQIQDEENKLCYYQNLGIYHDRLEKILEAFQTLLEMELEDIQDFDENLFNILIDNVKVGDVFESYNEDTKQTEITYDEKKLEFVVSWFNEKEVSTLLSSNNITACKCKSSTVWKTCIDSTHLFTPFKLFKQLLTFFE